MLDGATAAAGCSLVLICCVLAVNCICSGSRLVTSFLLHPQSIGGPTEGRPTEVHLLIKTALQVCIVLMLEVSFIILVTEVSHTFMFH